MMPDRNGLELFDRIEREGKSFLRSIDKLTAATKDRARGGNRAYGPQATALGSPAPPGAG